MSIIHLGKSEQSDWGSLMAEFAVCLLYLHLCTDTLSRPEEVEDVQMVLDFH